MRPLTLSQASGVPYYRQLVDQLTALVRGGEIAPETQLPSVRELARDLVVSGITVRRAYADLEAAGIVERRQGQGTFVTASVSRAAKKQAIAEARRLLVEAVTRARQLGMGDEEQMEFLRALLQASGGHRASR